MGGRRRGCPGRVRGRGRQRPAHRSRVPGLGRPPGGTGHPRLRHVRARARRGVRTRHRRRPGPLRVREPRDDHDLPRLVDRAPAPARPAHRALRLHRQDRGPEPERLGRGRHPRLHRRRRAGDGGDAREPPRVGDPAGRPAGGPLRHDPAADVGRGRADRRLLVRRCPRGPRRTVGLQRPDRGTRIGERIVNPGVNLYSDPAHPGLECCPFATAATSGNEESVFDNGLPSEAPTGSATAS